MSSNWWANKMGNTTPQNPTQGVAAPYTPPSQGVPAPYTQQSFPPTTPQPAYVPQELQDRRMPQSAKNAEMCPGCGSGNYGKTTPEHKARCYDCGYPVTQSGSGLGGVNTGQAKGPVMPSKQVASGGFNPTTIIGHI